MSLKSTPEASGEVSTNGKAKKCITSLYRFNEGYPTQTVPAYRTETAGLVVTKTYHLDHDLNTGNLELVVIRGSWDIVLYPFGQQILSGFHTKGLAVDVANGLCDFKWISFFSSDVERNNDMNKLRERIRGIKKEHGV